MEENKVVAVENTQSDYKYSYINQAPTKYDMSMHKVGKLWMGGYSYPIVKCTIYYCSHFSNYYRF